MKSSMPSRHRRSTLSLCVHSLTICKSLMAFHKEAVEWLASQQSLIYFRNGSQVLSDRTCVRAFPIVRRLVRYREKIHEIQMNDPVVRIVWTPDARRFTDSSNGTSHRDVSPSQYITSLDAAQIRTINYSDIKKIIITRTGWPGCRVIEFFHLSRCSEVDYDDVVETCWRFVGVNYPLDVFVYRLWFSVSFIVRRILLPMFDSKLISGPVWSPEPNVLTIVCLRNPHFEN